MRQMAMNLVGTCNSWNKILGLRGNLNFLQSQLEDKINRETDFVSLLKRSNTGRASWIWSYSFYQKFTLIKTSVKIQCKASSIKFGLLLPLLEQ
mgnify:CR=1 FL=1